MHDHPEKLGIKLRDEISRFVRESPENRNPDSGEPYFDEPLLGFASLGDPLFAHYQQVIGPYHTLPSQLLERAYGALSQPRGTVICWILPITASTRASNCRQKRWPSRQWAYNRTHGEAFNNLLRGHVVQLLNAMGQRALAPMLTEDWHIVETAAGPSPTWSERHAAYAAGLGTFSLSDGFITEKGMAHRCGSVITDLVLPPSPRPYQGRAGNCLFYREGTCCACIARCPAGAISRDGHDKKKCYQYTNRKVTDAVGKQYGVAALGCGLCQTGVPCESALPGGKK